MESYTANWKPEKRWTAAMESYTADGGLSDDEVAAAARVSATVLLTGPARLSLTAARRIHDESDRREGPFTVVDGGGPATAVIEGLVEAFGDPLATSRQATRAAGTGSRSGWWRSSWPIRVAAGSSRQLPIRSWSGSPTASSTTACFTG
jgi:hypothetical protein